MAEFGNHSTFYKKKTFVNLGGLLPPFWTGPFERLWSVLDRFGPKTVHDPQKRLKMVVTAHLNFRKVLFFLGHLVPVHLSPNPYFNKYVWYIFF